MLAENSDNQQLFNENNKETTVTSFATKSINDIHIEALKRKIKSVTQYQKPYISKLFYEILAKNPKNAKTICEYIIAEQNEFNIKESTKEDKIKRLFQLSRFFNHNKILF